MILKLNGKTNQRIISRRRAPELNPSLHAFPNRSANVLGSKANVLDPGARVGRQVLLHVRVASLWPQ